MNVATRLSLSLMIAVLALALSACNIGGAPKPKASLPFTDMVAFELLWDYEQAVRTGRGDPASYVTGPELEWLKRFQKQQAGGLGPQQLTWVASTGVIQVVQASDSEATINLQYDLGGKTYVVQFKFEPVSGDWKIANHQTPDGRWWTPTAKE